MYGGKKKDGLSTDPFFYYLPGINPVHSLDY